MPTLPVRATICLLALMGIIANPMLAQQPDVVGVLREDAVAVLWFQLTAEGWTYPAQATVPSSYVAHVSGGPGTLVEASPPMELLDDYDPIWGQLTSHNPVEEDCRCYPITRVGYVVSDASAEAPFRVIRSDDSISKRVQTLVDSLASDVGSADSVMDTLTIWIAELGNDRMVVFDANRVTPAACLAVSGWFRENSPDAAVHVDQVNPHDCEYKGASRLAPWALLRRGPALLIFLERMGYEGLAPQLWQSQSGGAWQLAAGN